MSARVLVAVTLQLSVSVEVTDAELAALRTEPLPLGVPAGKP